MLDQFEFHVMRVTERVLVIWWSKEENKGTSSTVDVDGSGSSSEECAEAISFSLKKFRGSIRALSGQTTDSGGGGVLCSSKEKILQQKILINDESDDCVAPCTLHALQITFANPITLDIGVEEGIGFRNTM